jgi:16S rRNA processing protein RimM
LQLVVGRIGRAHGVSGEVAVVVRTDDPDSRFVDGTALRTDPVERGPLTIASSRWHSGRLLITFAGVSDRAGAESLTGTMLVVDIEDLPALSDPEEFYDHDLVGLSAVDTAGTALGTVADVIHGPGSDLLAITRTDGGETLVPFVKAIVPTVDVAAGRLVIDPPDGLFEL